MKPSTIYRRAAYLLESGQSDYQWSCWAICQVMSKHTCLSTELDEVLTYEGYFRPEDSEPTWGKRWANDGEDIKNCRILALCFMAAISEADNG